MNIFRIFPYFLFQKFRRYAFDIYAICYISAVLIMELPTATFLSWAFLIIQACHAAIANCYIFPKYILIHKD